MSLAERGAFIGEIESMHSRTGIGSAALLSFLGLPRSTWNEWHKRDKAETRYNHDTPKSNWATPEETRKKGFDQPTHPNEQWHTDYSYVRICGVFYYFACILDGLSRKIIVWDLFPTMESINIEILVTRAKEVYPDAQARIIHDNGKQFTSKDFLTLVAYLELKETAAFPFHPQSNGKVERFHRTMKTEEIRRNDYHGIEDAKAKLGEWIRIYNSDRLHSAIEYLTPDEVFAGKKKERLAERREKMYNAIKVRQAYWKSQPT